MAADWLAAVIGDDVTDPYALLAIHPETADEHETIRSRLARAGFQRVNRSDVESCTWPLAIPAARAYLANETMAHMHTGRTRIQPKGGLVMTSRWLTAARTRGRVVVALIEPGSFTHAADIVDGTVMPVDVTEAFGGQLGAIADRRALIAGYVTTAEIPN